MEIIFIIILAILIIGVSIIFLKAKAHGNNRNNEYARDRISDAKRKIDGYTKEFAYIARRAGFVHSDEIIINYTNTPPISKYELEFRYDHLKKIAGIPTYDLSASEIESSYKRLIELIDGIEEQKELIVQIYTRYLLRDSLEYSFMKSV